MKKLSNLLYRARFLLLLAAALALISRQVVAQVQLSTWLPVVLAAEPEPTPTPSPTPDPPNTNPVHNGVATFYEADGSGACTFGATPDDLMVVALRTELFDGSAACGMYMDVTGPKGTVRVRVTDLCPGCGNYGLDLDMSQQAFEKIANLSAGRANITWQMASPRLSGPVKYRFKEGSNQWWTAVQIRNHRNPIARFEYQNEDGDWVEVDRTSYNYFVQTGPGMGPGPYTFRITDVYGNTLTDTDIPMDVGHTEEGEAQFPWGAFP